MPDSPTLFDQETLPPIEPSHPRTQEFWTQILEEVRQQGHIIAEDGTSSVLTTDGANYLFARLGIHPEP